MILNTLNITETQVHKQPTQNNITKFYPLLLDKKVENDAPLNNTGIINFNYDKSMGLNNRLGENY